jgi:hypothetical protein
MFSGLGDDTIIHTLDYVTYKELCYIYDTTPIVKQVASVIKNLAMYKLTIRRGRKHLQVYSEKYFLPLCKSTLRDIFTLGWTAVHLRKKKDLVYAEHVPVDLIMVELHVDPKKFTHEFKVFDFHHEPIRGVEIFFFDSIDKYANHKLIHSPMLSVLSEFRYVEHIKKFTLQSEYTRSNPCIFLASAKTATTQGSLASEANAFRGGYSFAERATPPMSLKDKFFAKASEEIEANMQFHNKQYEDLVQTQNTGYYSMGLSMTPQWANNVYVVPPGMSLAAAPQLPQSRNDQIQLHHNLNSLICTTIGIPPTILQSLHMTRDHKSIKNESSSILDIALFEATIKQYVIFYQRMIAALYKKIFLTEIDYTFVEFHVPDMYKFFVQRIVNGEREPESEDKKKQKTNEQETENQEDAQRQEGALKRKKDDTDDDEDDELMKKKKKKGHEIMKKQQGGEESKRKREEKDEKDTPKKKHEGGAQKKKDEEDTPKKKHEGGAQKKKDEKDTPKKKHEEKDEKDTPKKKREEKDEKDTPKKKHEEKDEKDTPKKKREEKDEKDTPKKKHEEEEDEKKKKKKKKKTT